MNEQNQPNANTNGPESSTASSSDHRPVNQSEASGQRSPQTRDSFAAKSAARGDQVLKFIAEVEKNLNQLRDASIEQATLAEVSHQARVELETRQQALSQLQQEIEERQDRLRARETELDAARKKLDDRETEVAKQIATFEEYRSEMENEQNRLSERTARLAHDEQTLRNERDEFNTNRQAFDEERKQLNDHIEKNEALQRDLEKQTQDLISQQEERQRRRESIESAQAQIEADRNSLRDGRDALEEQLKQLGDEESRISKQRSQLEDRSRQINEREESMASKEHEMEAATRKISHERDSVQVIKDELARDRLTVQEEQQSLEIQRQEVKRDCRIVESERKRLDEERRAWYEAKSAGSVDGIDPDAGEAAADQIRELGQMLDQRQQEIDELRDQLAHAPSAAGDVDEQIESLRSELAKRNEAIATLSTHYRNLERQLENARESSADSSRTRSDDSGFIVRRRRRLQTMRQLLQQRMEQTESQEHIGATPPQEALRELAAQRKLIVEVRDDLAKAERKMIRKWAHAGTVTRLFLFLTTILFLGAASYFCVMQFVPANYIASATVSVQPRPGFPLTDEQRQTWQLVNEELIMSEGLLKSASHRLKQRGYADLGSVEALREFFASNLSNNSPTPGTIEFSLLGKGDADTRRILETYTIAFVSSSNSGRSRRTDGGKTKLVAPATVDTEPVRDHRLLYAGAAFGGSVFLLLPLGGLIYGRLRKAEAVFDSNGELFESMIDQRQWENIRQNTDGVSQEHVIE